MCAKFHLCVGKKTLLSKRAAAVYVRKCDEFKKNVYTHQKPYEREKMWSLWNLNFTVITHQTQRKEGIAEKINRNRISQQGREDGIEAKWRKKNPW